MSRTELEIVEAFVQRVNSRAEVSIEKTHKLEGSHYAAMMVELRELQSSQTRCRCDLQDEPDAPPDWHAEECPLYFED